MYKPTIPVLRSFADGDGFVSDLSKWYSNGSYIRREDGLRLAKDSYGPPVVILVGEQNDKRFAWQITDKILVERIKKYWDDYFGKYHTNCSSFAQYLTTGTFIECESKYGSLVVTQGMRPYEMASRIDVGDMVCLLYADKQIAKSRKHTFGKIYNRQQKHRHRHGEFTGAKAMNLYRRVFTPQEIRDMNTHLCASDFHFMVCVGRHQGHPVWLSQAGYAGRGEDQIPFSVTRGEVDGYPGDVPMVALVKKRR